MFWVLINLVSLLALEDVDGRHVEFVLVAHGEDGEAERGVAGHPDVDGHRRR